MDEEDGLAGRFECHRAHLQGVAYRMLGSLSEADDAVQEAWLRLSRSDPSDIENLGGWLTTVVSQVCLDMLRSRRSRRERKERLRKQEPEPATRRTHRTDPEREALLAESVGLALLVVLDRLTPAQRIAFVLHDVFALPFDEIASVVDRSPSATRKLASRARRRVRGTDRASDVDLERQREVVEAFLAASRDGDFDALVGVLDPDAVLRADRVAVPPDGDEAHCAADVAERALAYSRRAPFSRPALVNGDVGIVVAPKGRLAVVLDLTITGNTISEIDVIIDPESIRDLDLAVLD